MGGRSVAKIRSRSGEMRSRCGSDTIRATQSKKLATRMSETDSSPERNVRRRLEPPVLGILNVNGGGIRVYMSRNDSKDRLSIVKQILTTKNEDSDYYKKFKGFKHSKKLTIDGENFGLYSYRWKLADTEAGATPAILQSLFESTDHVKTNPAQQYSPVNRRVVVKLLRNGDPVWM